MNAEPRIQEIEAGASAGIDMDGMDELLSLDDLTGADLTVEEFNAIEELTPESIEEELSAFASSEFEELEELTAADEAILTAAEIREEVYASGAPSEMAELGEEEDPVAAPVAAPKERKTRAPGAKKAKAPATPKVERSLSALPDSVFVLDEEAPVDLAANKVAVLALRPTQKKIAEKWDNFFPALNANRAPSVYAMHVFRALKVAPASTMTMKDMVAALLANGYTIGTARSQAGQIAFLFTLLKVVNHVGGGYALNTKSPIAGKLDALATLAA